MNTQKIELKLMSLKEKLRNLDKYAELCIDEKTKRDIFITQGQIQALEWVLLEEKCTTKKQ